MRASLFLSIVAGAALFCLITSGGIVGNPTSPQRSVALQDLPRQLTSATRDQRRELLLQFETERTAAAKELKRIIVAAEKQPGYDSIESEWHTSVLLLGYLGDVTHCEFLLDRLMIRVPRSESRRETIPSNFFPAMEALQHIGSPSIQPILKNLSTGCEGDEKRRQLCCLALHTIFGQEYGKDLAAAAVRAAIKRTQTPEHKAELQRALEVIEKFPN